MCIRWKFLNRFIAYAHREPSQLELDKSVSSGKVIVAAFDMDDTLITSASSLRFNHSAFDWKFLPNVRATISDHIAELKKGDQPVVTVVFSNQGGVIPDFDSKSFLKLRGKVEGMLKALPCIDMFFAAAITKDPEQKKEFRKPGPGMFILLEDIIKTYGLDIDFEQSFFVGDAAGRYFDHSDDDLKFAQAAHLPFITTEEFFSLDKVPTFDTRKQYKKFRHIAK